MPSWWLACGDQSQCIGIGSALEALRDDALYKYTFTFLYFTSGTLLVVVAVTSFVSCARYMQYVLYTDCTKSRDITIEHLKFDLTQLLFSFLSHSAVLEHIISIGSVSVCPSVRHMHAGTASQLMMLGLCVFRHQVAQTNFHRHIYFAIN